MRWLKNVFKYQELDNYCPSFSLFTSSIKLYFNISQGPPTETYFIAEVFRRQAKEQKLLRPGWI